MTARKQDEVAPITVVRSIKHKVSMGNYEGVEIFASVAVEVDGGVLQPDLRRKLDEALEQLVEGDLNEALRVTNERKTYVQYWKNEE